MRSTAASLSKRGLFWLVALLFLSRPACASLRIAGSSHHAALWQRIYDRLPVNWKTDQAILVEEIPAAELNAIDHDEEDDVNQDASADGVYEEAEDGPPSIRLSDALNDRESGLVFAHEYGHFVWSNKLTRQQRRDYRHLWWRQSRAGHLVTEYADDSPEEGFAESFSYFLLRTDRLRRRDMESWRFLTRMLHPEGPGAQENLEEPVENRLH